jgi:hypothetical protein
MAIESASEFIVALRRDIPTAEVIRLGKEAGLIFNAQAVYNARSQHKNGKRKKKPANGQPANGQLANGQPEGAWEPLVSKKSNGKFSAKAAGLSGHRVQQQRAELRRLVFALGTVTARVELEAVESIQERGL